jgi:hypothetical protein
VHKVLQYLKDLVVEGSSIDELAIVCNADESRKLGLRKFKNPQCMKYVTVFFVA